MTDLIMIEREKLATALEKRDPGRPSFSYINHARAIQNGLEQARFGFTIDEAVGLIVGTHVVVLRDLTKLDNTRTQ